MSIVLEVGANNGQHTDLFIETYDDVYCFEPIPKLHYQLMERFGHNKKFHGINAAIDTENGWKSFHISERRDWGCSSLHNFTPRIDEKWTGREDFVFTKNIEHMLCMRLDTFMNLYGIEEVDYLHIDAQGNDFNILKSLGDKVWKVKKGVCEAANNISLYDVDNTKDSILAWFDSIQLFDISITNDGPAGEEVNIHFERGKFEFERTNCG